MSTSTWYEYYPDEPALHDQNAHLKSNSGSYYVYNVMFSGITGQCICLTDNDQNKLLANFVTFSELRGTVDGLGIYMNNGQCAQLHICDINPDNKMVSDYAHSYVMLPTPNSARTPLSSSDYYFENSIKDSTISSAISKCATFLEYGYSNKIENVNNSYATCNNNAFAKANNLFYIKYCSIINNTANKAGIIYLQGWVSSIEQCNFIKNEDKHKEEENGIVIYSDSGYYINCIESLAFIKNKCQYLFFIKGGSPAIKNCYLKNNEFTSLIYDNSIDVGTTNEISNKISYFTSYLCQDGDIAGVFEHFMSISKTYRYVYLLNTILSMPVFIFLSRE